MKITEIVMTLAQSHESAELDGVLAFVSVVFDDKFAVKDIKLLKVHDRILLGMPNRKVTDHCTKCGAKNALTDKFCHQCGEDRKRVQVPTDTRRLFADVAFPIKQEFRTELEEAIIRVYNTRVPVDKGLKVSKCLKPLDTL